MKVRQTDGFCTFYTEGLPQLGEKGHLSVEVDSEDDGTLAGWHSSHELVVIGYAQFPSDTSIVIVLDNLDLDVTSTVDPDIFVKFTKEE